MNIIKCDSCESTTVVIDENWYDLPEYNKHFCCIDCLHVWVESIRKKQSIDNRLDVKDRFIDKVHGTVIDTKTNLMWEKKGSSEVFTWEESKTWVKNIKNAYHLGYCDWRLPTIEELSSLIDYSREDPAIDPIFYCHPEYYWSSTGYVSGISYAWLVFFGNGSVFTYPKTNMCYVRFCRDYKED